MSEMAMFRQLPWELAINLVAYSVVNYGIIYFAPVFCSANRSRWPRNMVGSLAPKVRRVADSEEVEGDASERP
jgi:hypothetical protein